jgi:hypothetical protein
MRMRKIISVLHTLTSLAFGELRAEISIEDLKAVPLEDKPLSR